MSIAEKLVTIAENQQKVYDAGRTDTIANNVLGYVDETMTEMTVAEFKNNTKLKEIQLPLVTSIPSNAFYGCKSLETVNLPSLATAGTSAFNLCAALKSVFFPSLTTMGTSAFYNCKLLEFADLGQCTKIGQQGFRNTSLKTLVLRRPTVCELPSSASTMWAGSAFAPGGVGGKVYVPSTLIESYKTASNWSTMFDAGRCEFLPIEGSEYE